MRPSDERGSTKASRPHVHRSRLFLLGCIGFLGGIFVASFVVIAPVILYGFVFVGAVLLYVRSPRIIIAGILCLAFTVGAWRLASSVTQVSPLWSLAADKPPVTLTGYVDGDFETTATGGRFSFRVLRVMSGGMVRDVDDRILASGPDWIRPRQGQILELTGKIQQPHSYPDFDYVSYLAKNGIHATMYFPQYSVPLDFVLPWRTRVWLWLTGHLTTIRFAMTESISRAVPQPQSGYLTGILVGAKGVVSPQLKDEFARTGTSHILAISGYNITIVASVLMALLAPLGRRRSYWWAVAGIVLFTVMVGAGASVVRAAIMGVMAITATRLGRLNDAGTAMAFSAAAMCVFNPLLLRWDVGFQLSFLAFAGIVYIEPLIKPGLEKLLRFKTLASIVATTLSAQVFVLPVLLSVFGTFAMYTLPANLLVLPLVPIAMLLGFATAVAGIIWPLAGLLVGQSAWLIAAYQLAVIHLFAWLPYAVWSVHLSAAAVITTYAVLVAGLVSYYRVLLWRNAHSLSSNPIPSSALSWEKSSTALNARV